jgi:hypothetical protein
MLLRSLYAARIRSKTAQEQKETNLRLIAGQKAWAKLQIATVATRQTKRGRLVQCRSSLKTIEHVLEPRAGNKVDRKRGLDLIGEQFSRSWSCDDRGAHTITISRLAACLGQSLNITGQEVATACWKVGLKNSVDHFGVSSRAMAMWCSQHLELGAELLDKMMSGAMETGGLALEGFVKGKGKASCQTDRMRAVVPMPVLLAMLDSILAERLRVFVEMLPLPPHICVGGGGGVQLGDIAHGCAMILEKSMDDMSQGVVIQADVEKYYDQLPLWKCLDALALRGLDARTAAACVRLHWQSAVHLCALGSQVAIRPRSRGALTGSRSAVMLGKVPVETAVARLASAWVAKKWAWGLDGDTVSSAIYVDNVWLFSRTSGAALCMMKELQSELMEEWALKFKEESKEIMVARGNETETYHDEEWKGVSVMKVLGLFVSNDGATAKSVGATLLDEQRMGWGAASQVAKASIPWRRREKFLASMTEGLLNSRWHMWSPSLALSAKLDRVQRKLWSVALGIQRSLPSFAVADERPARASWRVGESDKR